MKQRLIKILQILIKMIQILISNTQLTVYESSTEMGFLTTSLTLFLITTDAGSFQNPNVHFNLGIPGSTPFILASSLKLTLGFPEHLLSELSRLFLTKIIQNHQKSSSILATVEHLGFQKPRILAKETFQTFTVIFGFLPSLYHIRLKIKKLKTLPKLKFGFVK